MPKCNEVQVIEKYRLEVKFDPILLDNLYGRNYVSII